MAFEWLSKLNIKYMLDKVKAYIDGKISSLNSDLANKVNKSGDTMTGTLVMSNANFIPSAGKDASLATGTSRLYKNAIVISNPATANDQGWIRVTGSGEGDTILEIATGDDGGAGEQIVVRQYNTSNAVAHQLILLNTAGNFVCGNTTIYSGGSNGGLNSMIVGDDVYLGDCNVGGMLGMKGTGNNAGIRLYKSTGALIGGFQSTNGTAQWINSAGTAYNIYHTGNKPSYTDVGAAAANHSHSYLPLSGGNLTGTVNINGDCSYKLNNRAMFYTLGTTVFGLCANGGATVRRYDNPNTYAAIYASSFSQQSSRLVKENIHPITGEIAKKVLKLNVVSFDYIAEVGGDKNNVGLIAEDVLEIYPDCVTIPEDYSEEKAIKDIFEGKNINVLGLDYAKFTPYLIKMIQIQQKEIDSLKQSLNKLL